LAEAKLCLGEETHVRSSWLTVIKELLPHADPLVSGLAVEALPHFCQAYLMGKDHDEDCLKLVNYLKENVRKTNLEISRQGHCLALGSLPKFMFANDQLNSVVQTLHFSASNDEKETAEWADARKNAVISLTQVVTTVGFGGSPSISPEAFVEITDVLLTSLGDYQTDSRGDIGSLVREAAITSIADILIFATMELQGRSDAYLYLRPNLVLSAIENIVQQACEKIDRTRGIASSAFLKLLWNDNPIPNFPRLQEIKTIFTKDVCLTLDWSSPAATFPLFGRLLSFNEFISPVLTGFVVSVGGLTETLVFHAGKTLTSHIHNINSTSGLCENNPESIVKFKEITDGLLAILRSHLKNDRVSLPYLKMMDQLLSAGCFDPVASSPICQPFALELVSLVKKEVHLTKSIAKLMAAADVLCGCLQFLQEVKKVALVQLTIFLCHRYPKMRKFTAEKLYEALITYWEEEDEIEGDEREEPELEQTDTQAHLEKAMTLLLESQWDSNDIEEIKGTRNDVCKLLGIKPPVAKKAQAKVS